MGKPPMDYNIACIRVYNQYIWKPMVKLSMVRQDFYGIKTNVTFEVLRYTLEEYEIIESKFSINYRF